MFRRKNPIQLLCRKSGNWVLTDAEKNGRHWVTHTRYQRGYSILVLNGRNETSTRFQCWLPVRFPLSNPPSGLFGRLMLRSWDLVWSAWVLNIGESCEAKACVTALVSNSALDASLFDRVCHEQLNEVASMHKELRDKFNYGGQFSAAPEPPMGGVNLPVPWQGNLPQRPY